MDKQKIGAFILDARKGKGLTQSELAQKLFVTDRAVSNWECGLRFPDVSIIQPLCKYLDISVNDLLNGEKVAEHEKVQKAEQQLVTQLKEQEKIKKRLWIISNCAMFAFLVLLPVMIIVESLANDYAVRSFFVNFCGVAMVFSFVLAVSLRRIGLYGSKLPLRLSIAVVVIGVLLMAASLTVMITNEYMDYLDSITLMSAAFSIGLAFCVVGVIVILKFRVKKNKVLNKSN